MRAAFDSLVVLTCWIVWKERNNRTFDRCVKTLDEVLAWVVDEILFWLQAGFRCLEYCLIPLGSTAGRTVVLVWLSRVLWDGFPSPKPLPLLLYSKLFPS